MVGVRILPVFAVKTGAYFAATFGIIALVVAALYFLRPITPALQDLGVHRDVRLVVSGGIRTGADVAARVGWHAPEVLDAEGGRFVADDDIEQVVASVIESRREGGAR